MNSFKAKILCLAPMTLGLYCLFQGFLLLASEDLLVQCLGIGLFLWVPACGYYTWKGRTAFSQVFAVRTRTQGSRQQAPVFAQVAE